jgi:hypothetical protein
MQPQKLTKSIDNSCLFTNEQTNKEKQKILLLFSNLYIAPISYRYNINTFTLTVTTAALHLPNTE